MTGRFTKLLGYSIVAVFVLMGVGRSNGLALGAQIRNTLATAI